MPKNCLNPCAIEHIRVIFTLLQAVTLCKVNNIDIVFSSLYRVNNINFAFSPSARWTIFTLHLITLFISLSKIGKQESINIIYQFWVFAIFGKNYILSFQNWKAKYLIIEPKKRLYKLIRLGFGHFCLKLYFYVSNFGNTIKH